MSTTPTPPDFPPYHLQHLLSNVNNLLGGSRSHPDGSSSRTMRGTVEVRCAQALGTEIYVGCSNGSLLRYAFVDSLASSADSYQLLIHQSLPSGKAIEKIALVPSVERALVLCDNQIHFFTLPNLEPVQINPVRRVVTFALDEAQQRKSPPDPRSHRSPQLEAVRLCVIKPNAITVYSLGERLMYQKELPLPNGVTLARLSNEYLCVADTMNYNIINIETTDLIPLIPLSQAVDAPNVPITPSITVISENEFLLLSWTGTSSLGVFITGHGDPIRGTLAWETHPASLSCDYPYVTSVLPNGTIEVQNLDTQAICQTILPHAGFVVASLETALTGFVVPCGEQLQKLNTINFPLLEPETPNTSAIEDGSAVEEHLAQYTQPPPRGDSLNAAVVKKHPVRQPKARVLAVGVDAVHALVMPSLIQQADALLDAHKLKEAAELVRERQKKMSQSLDTVEFKRQTEELHYVYQRLGYTCLSETLFEEAGNHLFRGNVDPRMLIRLFSTLRGTLLVASTPSLPVFAGLAPQILALGTVDTIIVMNLVKNYTPHLQPSTRSAPSTSELRKLLIVSAREMLRGYLHKWKNKVKYSGEQEIKEVSQAIDTVLVKLFAESEDVVELYALVDSSEEIVVEEVEETLTRMKQYNPLIKLYRRHGDDDKLLSAWAKIVEGEWIDENIRDPLGEMMALLGETHDRTLVRQWGLWVVKRDVKAGLKLLMSGDAKRSDDAALLTQLEGVSPEASQHFLEHLVLEKHSNDPNLHERLAQVYLDRLIPMLQTETVLDYFRDITLEYSIQNTSTPFLVYLASTARSTSFHEHVCTRCRTALFFQGSSLYDVKAVRARLSAWEDVLGYELAILNGKLGNHIEALKGLVHTLRDTASADAYCALGGCPLSPKAAQVIGDKLDLHAWAALILNGSKVRHSLRKLKGNKKEDLERTRERLLKVLLEVYMSGGDATEDHAARLLNSQGGDLDVLDVVTIVPPDWSLSVVSSFLARSLRRTVHEGFEGEILKAVCLGQNLAVRDNAYTAIRAQGAFIEEPIKGEVETDPNADGEKILVVPLQLTGEKVVEGVDILETTKEAEESLVGVGTVDGEVT